MKLSRRVALAVLVLISAVVVIASPAFATPRFTTSTGTAIRPDNGATSPFATPIGDTLTSSITVTSIYATRDRARLGSSFSVTTLAGAADAITCLRLTASAEVGATHTHVKIYSLDFLGCRDDANGFVVHVVVNHISSSNPYLIHITSTVAGDAASWNGVLEIPAGSTISIFMKFSGIDICTLKVDLQSVRLIATTRNTSIEVSRAPVRFALMIPAPGGTACPDASRTAAQTTVTNIRYTADDRAAYTLTTTSGGG